jgi:predicted ATPase
MEIDKSLIELISSIFAETMIIHQEEKQQANEPLLTSAAMSSLHTTIDADRNDSLQSNSVNVTVAVAKTPVVVKQLPASSPRNHMDDDYTSSTVLTSTTISSSAQQEDKDEPPPKILQPPLQMDEQHVLHLRSDAMAAIVRCYNQVVCYEESSLPTTKIPTAIRSNTTTDCPSISTFLLVTGPTGAGKTKLVQYSLQDLVRQRGGYYIRGKFDMLQHPDPYQAYVSAFTDFTFQVLQRGPDQVRAMRDAIHEACSTETCVLVQMIPALSAIINFQDDCVTTSTTDDHVVTTTTIQSDVSPSNHQYHNDDAAIQRFVFVLQTFLRAVSSLEQPIILLLDDLQWSDPSSVDVMCSVLTNLTKSPGLFVVGTYNGDDDMEHDDLHDETKETSFLWRKLREMKIISNGLFVVQTVPIHDFDMDQVKYVLKRTLQQGSLIDLQIDDSLSSIVMKETNGNLFLMIEFLKWLCGVGLLTTNCPQNCGTSFTYWTWSVDDINLAILDRLKVCATNDSKYYVSHKLEQLPMEMIDVLKVGAYFGDSHMEGKIIEYVLDYPISPMLSQAVDMGILTASNSDDGGVKMYSFEHDSLQMAVYNMVPESNRELFHLEIGRRLWRRLRKDELDHYIFVVLSHMIVGQRLITRPTERYSIASLCLHAGKKAANMSNFQVVSIYLNFGVQLLGDRGWRDEYDLSLMIYNAAAEMEICKANFEGMEALIESIFRNSRCFEDKIQAKTSQIYALGVNDRQQDGLDLGIQLLTDLGTPLPKSFSKFVLRIDLNAVQKLLRGKSNDYLKRLPVIEDRDILASLHVLNLVSTYLRIT